MGGTLSNFKIMPLKTCKLINKNNKSVAQNQIICYGSVESQYKSNSYTPTISQGYSHCFLQLFFLFLFCR